MAAAIGKAKNRIVNNAPSTRPVAGDSGGDQDGNDNGSLMKPPGWGQRLPSRAARLQF